MSPELVAALAGLARRHRAGAPVLVALDLDGTLAPLRDDPDAVRIPPPARAALDRLAAAAVPLALVSGRGLADLARVARVPGGTHLVGSHGAERGVVGPRGEVTGEAAGDAAPAGAALLAELADRLAVVVGEGPARLERKPHSVVVHTRGVERGEARRVADRARAVAAQAGVAAMAGHDVVELLVARASKGEALGRLRGDLGVEPGALLFAGDDVTDETAFAALPADVTVKVGPGETAARHRLADPAEVARALAHLADLVGPSGA